MVIISLISVILFFSLVGIWKLFDHFRKFNYNEQLFKNVGWIAEKKNIMRCYGGRVNLRNSGLISYIFQQQKKLAIPEDLRINYSNENEKANAEEILNIHKSKILIDYFSDDLTTNKNIFKLNSLEYYFYSLFCFICSELEEYKNYQDKIYLDKEYTDKTNFKCKLTDYGRVYYKLYLITCMFVEKNEKTRKLFEYINPELKSQIMEHLRTNEVTFWSYRP